MVLCETKTIRMDTIQDSWPETGVEWIPETQAGVTTAPRAGVATLIFPGKDYSVVHIHNETDRITNGVIQALTFALDGGRQIAKTYVSTGSSNSCLDAFLDLKIRNGSNATWLIGDLNARARELDSTTNSTGRALLRRI